MTRLRERAREIKEAGEAERGNRTPSSTGWPMKFYRYWLEESNNLPPERENFCHYYRVVLFWAPVYWLTDKLDNAVVGWIAGLSVLGVLGWLSYQFVDFRIVLGLIVGMLTIGTCIAFAINKLWRKSWEKPLMVIFGVLVGAALVWLLGSLVWLIWQGVGWWLLGGVGVIAAFIGAGVFASDWIAGRRRLKKEAYTRWFLSLTPEEQDEHVRKTREPGWMFNVLVAMGDFFILLGQVVRVKKWKICPFVELPE